METVVKTAILRSLAVLCLVGAPASAWAADVKFDIINNSARSIDNFYTSTSDTTNWEEDVLGEDTIGPGETDTITISTDDGQCLYDMRFIMEDKAELIEKGIDVCKLSSYTLTDAK
jgi:hypothetical protein